MLELDSKRKFITRGKVTDSVRFGKGSSKGDIIKDFLCFYRELKK